MKKTESEKASLSPFSWSDRRAQRTIGRGSLSAPLVVGRTFDPGQIVSEIKEMWE